MWKDQQKQSYTLYYDGMPQHEVDDQAEYVHPRQLMNDLDNPKISKADLEVKVLRRLGIDVSKYLNRHNQRRQERIEAEYQDNSREDAALRY